MSGASAKLFTSVTAIGAGLLALIATPLWAHPAHGTTSGFLQGFAHPLFGTDHLLAMIAVGLWAAQGDSRRVWTLPAAFVGGMLLGGIVGMGALASITVESGILLSVIVLGALVAAAVRPPLVVSVLIVAMFGILHGHAHGAEMPATISAFGYAAGFSVATALLHAAGASAAIFARRMAGSGEGMTWVRVAGSAIATAGMVLVLAA